jgi:DNA repair protein RadC
MQLAGKSNEEFHVLYLDGNFRLIEHEVHSKGSIDSSNVYIDRILQKALNKGVKRLVLLHNHPVTDNMFSIQDVELTQTIETTLNTCNLSLYDHYVIVNGVMYSLRATGLLNKSQIL